MYFLHSVFCECETVSNLDRNTTICYKVEVVLENCGIVEI
jgi:hypothetical protein